MDRPQIQFDSGEAVEVGHERRPRTYTPYAGHLSGTGPSVANHTDPAGAFEFFPGYPVNFLHLHHENPFLAARLSFCKIFPWRSPSVAVQKDDLGVHSGGVALRQQSNEELNPFVMVVF